MRRIAALVLALVSLPSHAAVLQLADTDAVRLAALDRTKTVVLIPGGILEEHGPYLPSQNDGLINRHYTEALARAIDARPGWNVLVFPMIPLGSGGANEIGGRYAFPGTYAVRPSTLRAVMMDLASELGDQGFKWVFVIHSHGSPDHNRALDQASDFFSQTYGGTMIALTGYMAPSREPEIMKGVLGASLTEDGFTVHAGASEQARAMALRPDLVPVTVAQARPVTVAGPEGLATAASADGWPGYFGSPRLATAALGKALLDDDTQALVTIALGVLDGTPPPVPRYADVMATVPPINAIMAKSREHDRERRQRQLDWLAAHHLTEDAVAP